MSLPQVVTYSLAASSATSLVNAQASGTTTFTLATTILDAQRRLLFTFGADESANTFTVIGTNQAGFPINEAVAGVNASTTSSNLDFKTVSSVRAIAASGGTVSVGTYGVGSSLWQIQNWHADPTDISVVGIVTSPNTAVVYSVDYTYDDPNNLPSGVTYPTPITHINMNNLSSTGDASIVAPVTAVRLTINSGTGSVRAIFTQAGIGSP